MPALPVEVIRCRVQRMMNSTSRPPAVEVRGLVVRRGGGRPILDGVDLTLPGGRITGLLGPSGCGKTTLMRAIVGVQIVVAGDVLVLGELAGSAGLRRRVGYVTQAPSIYADLTVVENLDYFARILAAPPGRIDEVLRMVDLVDRAGQPVSTLSGGERSRVSLAVALLAEPELLVLDEPTVGLDPRLRRDLWATFRTLADAGATLLVSSHVLDEAARCDEVVLMRDGAIIAQSTPEGLLEDTGASDIEEAFLALTERRAA
jgi:ABC-2 type transport system ATP-binding protein